MKVYIISMTLPTPNANDLGVVLKVTGKVSPVYYQRLLNAFIKGETIEITIK